MGEELLPRDLVPLAKAAHMADVSEQTFRKWIKNGDYPAYRKGKKNPNVAQDNRPIFVRLSDLNARQILEPINP